MDKEQLAALAVIEQLTVKTSGDVRDVVGYIDCRCGCVSKVVRGKVKIYESCSACGIKLANGNANTKYILENMRLTPEKPESFTEKTTEPTPKNAAPIPEKHTETTPKKSPSFLVRAAKAVLAFELFEL